MQNGIGQNEKRRGNVAEELELAADQVLQVEEGVGEHVTNSIIQFSSHHLSLCWQNPSPRHSHQRPHTAHHTFG